MKVVYFDESSALDYLTITNNGIKEETEEKRSEVAAKGKVSGGIEAKMGKLLSVIPGLKVEVGASAEVKKAAEKIITSSVTNTVLSDFINKSRLDDEVRNFKGYKMTPYPKSIEYIQLISPYLLMTDGKVPIDGGVSLDVSKIYDALKIGKGYYELVGKNISEGEKVILRFNNEAFAHNYSIADLVSMDLELYGIKSGSKDIKKLDFATFMVENVAKRIKTDNEQDDGIAAMYDVILAGVVAHGEN